MFSLKLIEPRKLLLSGGGDQKINVWSYTTGRHVIIDSITGHSESIYALKISRRSRELFSIDYEGTVYKWETHNFTALGKFKDFTGTELDNCFDVSSDGRYIYAPDRDNPSWLRIVDTLDFSKAAFQNEDPRKGTSEPVILKRHTKDIKSVKVVEDLELLITAGKDNMILLWHLKKHFLTRPPMYDRHSDLVSSLQIVEQTGYLITGGYDRVLNVFDISTNFNFFHRIKVDFKIRTIRASKDGQFVLCGGQSCQKVKMVSTSFLVSKLKRDENLRRKKSVSSEDDQVLLNQSKINHNGSFLSNNQNLHFINSEAENSANTNSPLLVFPDLTKPRRKQSFRKSFHETSPQLLLGLDIPSNREIELKTKTFRVETVVSYQRNIKDDRAGSFNEQMDDAMEFLHGRHLSRFDEWRDRFAEKTESNIRIFKENIFATCLERFRASTVHELERLETPRSVFFHEFRNRHHSFGPESLKNAIHRFSQKVHAGASSPELKMDFHDIVSIVHKNRKSMQNLRAVERVRKGLELQSAGAYIQRLAAVDEKAEKRKMLEGCIRMLQQQLKQV